MELEAYSLLNKKHKLQMGLISIGDAIVDMNEDQFQTFINIIEDGDDCELGRILHEHFKKQRE